MKPIQGLHHITAAASDPQRNLDFYETILGQRLVKTTVNFDDPGTYHLYYGDLVGTPGTIMTFFPWPNMRRGRRGIGEAAAVGYAIPDGSIVFWQDRLIQMDVEFSTEDNRFGDAAILLQDPDGMPIELIESSDPTTIDHWGQGPIPAQHALRGFHSVTLWLDTLDKTADLLKDGLGYTFVNHDGERHRYKAASNDRALYVDLLKKPGMNRGAFGAGSIHHIAFRTVDDEEQQEYLDLLRSAGQQVTPVKDRQYFHSIYFREPGGVLFEVATDAPGFAYDEPVEHLGSSLKLPSWLEGKRQQIEDVLPPLHRNHVTG
ncbi:MAG: ring-cleaving dioxygenase [Rhodothermales bacterium]|nr:ring-cleaving dioxygenase [Rhodothermales bacterium]